MRLATAQTPEQGAVDGAEAQFAALGANPQKMKFSEVYQASTDQPLPLFRRR